MRLIILPVVAIIIATEATEWVAADVVKFPNIRYLGMGYNLLKGNPDDNWNDPGFRLAVLQFEWDQGRMSSDGRYEIPDHIQAMQVKSCGYESVVESIAGADSLTESLSVDVSVDASVGFGMWSARFSASTSYQKVNEKSFKQKRKFTTAKAKCIEYVVTADYLYSPIKVTESFIAAVKALPVLKGQHDQSQKVAYHRFIETFGTHITVRLTMGAKMVMRSEFTERSWNSMESEGIKVGVAVQASFAKVASVGASAETEYARDQREKMESKRESYTASYQGSHPPTNGRWETWAQAAGDTPAPISYKLLPIIYLLQEKYLGILTQDLQPRRKLLRNAFKSYCNSLKGCKAPAPDPIIPPFKSTYSTFVISPTKVSCSPRDRLLSCGLKALVNKTSAEQCDPKRYAIPAAERECECGDANGGMCKGWCVRVTMDVQAVTKEGGENTTVSCPSKYKVLHYSALFFERPCNFVKCYLF